MKALEIAEKIGAAEVNPKASPRPRPRSRKPASTRDKKAMADQARVAAQLASQAIKDTVKVKEEQAAAEAEAKRLAERAASNRGDHGRRGVARIAQELKEVQIQREALAARRGTWPSSRRNWRRADQLAAEKSALAPSATPSRRNATSWPEC